MRNFEKHEWDIQQLGLNFGVYKDFLFECHNDKDFDCKDCLFYINGKCNYTEKIKWFNEDYKEQHILTNEEKEYLEYVLRPFKNKIKYITKREWSEKNAYISIGINDDNLRFPYFKKGTKYNGMELFQYYTIYELELFKGEE